jgi:bifunctional NMN adenylyltransferase/nudix hydrolase
MSKPYGTLVFIGRFQPLHKGHIHVIAEAAKLADIVLVLVGSANLPRTPRNPFTYRERENMIYKDCLDLCSEYWASLYVRPIDDHPYNDTAWLAEINSTIMEEVSHKKTGLVGYSKDKSSYYLKMFPGLSSVAIEPDQGLINATDIRHFYFGRLPFTPTEVLPTHTANFLKEFYKTQTYRDIQAEAQYIQNYDPAKWPVQVCCADAVVTQSGHLLLVQRKGMPGKGLLALPGGHKGLDETFEEAAIRELREETHLSDNKGELPPAMLRSMIKNRHLFDDPRRSQRCTVITQAFHFELPNATQLYKVKGDDDAEFAQWYNLGELNPTMFFDDHAFIIEKMLGNSFV